MMTRNQPEWIKASELRDQVRHLLGYSPEQMGHAQWVGHILNRLQLTDRNRRKAYTAGQMYAVERDDVLDMMRRYDVGVVEKSNI